MQKSTKSARAVGYVRASTDKQRMSPEVQRDKIRKYAALRDLELMGYAVDEAVSSGVPFSEREGGKKVLGLMRARKVGHLIVTELSRAFRSVMECELALADLLKYRVSLHMVDAGGNSIDLSTAFGKATLRISAFVAQIERDQISERTAAALAYRKSTGRRYSGKPPYGYRFEQDGWTTGADGRRKKSWRMVEHAVEQRACKLIFSRHLAGSSLPEIKAELDALGPECPPRAGGKWNLKTIRRILDRALQDAATQT